MAPDDAPPLALGQVAFLEVTAFTATGALFEIAPGEALLVPLAEQTAELRPGDRHPIGLVFDDRGRLTGTMRVSEMLKERPPDGLRPDTWVEGEAWRNDPDIGLFVIVERRYVGLVPAAEPHGLSRGEGSRFRVSNVLPDGKIELSLRGHAHQELESDARRILEVLARPGAPRIGDRSSPEDIRRVFGLSKKAFKRAAGRLLRDGEARVDEDGMLTKR